MFWKNADESDKTLFKALSLLYGHNPDLLHYLLNPGLPRLNFSSKVIKHEALALSSGEELLIRVGLDIWDGSGGINFNELYQKLDNQNFQKVILVLIYLRSPKEASLF